MCAASRPHGFGAVGPPSREDAPAGSPRPGKPWACAARGAQRWSCEHGRSLGTAHPVRPGIRRVVVRVPNIALLGMQEMSSAMSSGGRTDAGEGPLTAVDRGRDLLGGLMA